MDDALKTAIIQALTDLIVDLVPDANLRSMYGGTVIALEADVPKSRVGGVYAYADYVSLELAKGVDFDDPNGLLEGAGKFRRHVKLYAVTDVANKACRHFLEQAIAGAQAG